MVSTDYEWLHGAEMGHLQVPRLSDADSLIAVIDYPTRRLFPRCLVDRRAKVFVVD